MLQCLLPANVGVGIEEVVMMVMPVGLSQVIGQLRIGHWSSLKAGIHTGLIECNRIKGSEHSYIGKYWRIIL